MPAYVIANVDVHDPVRYERYKRVAEDSIARHGGRYLARGGVVQVLEGDWQPRRLVILEFPTAEAARAWYDSADYAPGITLRQATAHSQLVMVDGL